MSFAHTRTCAHPLLCDVCVWCCCCCCVCVCVCGWVDGYAQVDDAVATTKRLCCVCVCVCVLVCVLRPRAQVDDAVATAKNAHHEQWMQVCVCVCWLAYYVSNVSKETHCVSKETYYV